MEPIESLLEDHRAIGRALACLEVAAQRLQMGEPVRLGLFIDVADFVADFADKLHHRKEEDALFPALEAAGVPKAQALLSEHNDERRFPAAIRAAAQQLAAGDAAVADQLVTNVRVYISRLRQHMFKEDNVLFPMARQRLDTQQHVALNAAFDDIEQKATGKREDCLHLLERLEQELNRSSPSAA